MEATPQAGPERRRQAGDRGTPSHHRQGQRPVSANNARGTLSSFFAWAIGEGLCESQSRHRHQCERDKAARPRADRCRVGGNMEGRSGQRLWPNRQTPAAHRTTPRRNRRLRWSEIT